MGRHSRPAPENGADPRHPDARLVETLPGWGLFATVVAATSQHWAGGSWSSVTAVTALGGGCTAVLWGAVRRGERLQRLLAQRTKVTMTSRSAAPSPDVPVGHSVTRRVTP